MKLFLLVPMVCLLGCGDPGPVSRTDAGEDTAEDADTIPDSGGSAEANDTGFVAEGGLIGCDCYTCPYGLGCRPSTTQPPPNPTTVRYPHGNTQM